MSRHVGMQLSAYVDRCLDPAALREIDRHLVACRVCCHAVEQERRLLASLRHGTTPRLSESLQASLLSLAGGHELTPAPQALVGRMAPVPTVSPSRPGLHRSPRRAAGLAGFAAGASAAAAIGLAVAGPGATASPLRPPAPRLTGSVAGSVSGLVSGSSSVGTGASLVAFSAQSGAASVRPAAVSLWTRSGSTGK